MYTYIYILYMHRYIYKYIYTYLYIYTYICMYIHIRVWECIFVVLMHIYNTPRPALACHTFY